MEYIRFDKNDKGYLIKKTGKVVKKGKLAKLQNRPGIDEFKHLGYIYSKQIHKGKIVSETETETIIELNVTSGEAEMLIKEEKELKPSILSPSEVDALFPVKTESGVT